MAAARPSAALDHETANVLRLRQQADGDLFAWQEGRVWGLHRNHYDSRTLKPILARLVRWGWIEVQSGRSRLAYRLTEAGLPFLEQAEAFLAAEQAEKERQWRRDHEVYGVDRENPTAPLTEVQAQAWVRGYFEHLVRQAPTPAGLPFEARHLFEEVRARTLRRMAPTNPFKIGRA